MASLSQLSDSRLVQILSSSTATRDLFSDESNLKLLASSSDQRARIATLIQANDLDRGSIMSAIQELAENAGVRVSISPY